MKKGTHDVPSDKIVLEGNDSSDLPRRNPDGCGGKSYRFTILPT